MQFTPILAAANALSEAAAKTEDIGLADSLPHLLGMLLVFVTLAALWVICVISAKLIKRFLPEPEATAPIQVKRTPSPTVQEGIPPEIVAVITAAVATVSGPSSRIVSVKAPSSTWSKAGRQSVLTSHKIR